ncbi:CHRD domain-containing protein [Caenimonas aquaedulcis]|uniref:CHRD domain-containing protein n=1 Tax=Caenimonas aquaedulcis TaxID=2793270 RepID=A0A931MFG5_9BURK|nr:CHRD domain-containing protein [Caenimonas aquaedulcis]MBG9387019.1 CHRD domain-containing protein [Caenimonas aquaedulcis]
MKKRHAVLRLAALAGALTLGLAGCAQMGMGSSMQVYKATLSGAQEVPANDSKGTGTAELRVDTKNNEMTWKVSFSGLSGPATAGHIHGPAPAGRNAGVLVPFAGVPNATSAEGKTSLTPAQMAELAAGNWYVNIHTAKHPGGEIRGQLQR